MRGFCFYGAEDGIRDSSVTGVQVCAVPGYASLREVGPGHGVLVVAVQHDRLHPGIARRPYDVEVIGQPREQVRVRMTVQVDRAGHVDERSVVRTLWHRYPS